MGSAFSENCGYIYRKNVLQIIKMSSRMNEVMLFKAEGAYIEKKCAANNKNVESFEWTQAFPKS